MFKNNFELYENIKSINHTIKEINASYLIDGNYQLNPLVVNFLYLLAEHKALFDLDVNILDGDDNYIKNVFFPYKYGFNPLNQVYRIFSNHFVIDVIPDEIITIYSNFCMNYIRSYIASYHKTSIEVLKKLSTDKFAGVANRARIQLMGRNEN